jgi:hypothetical protein
VCNNNEIVQPSKLFICFSFTSHFKGVAEKLLQNIFHVDFNPNLDIALDQTGAVESRNM